MERLTFLDTFGEPCYKLEGTVYKNEIANLLAAYEDTCMTPKEITRMAKEIETRFLVYCYEKYGKGVLEITDLLAAQEAGKMVQHIPGDTVYDRFGMAWTVTSSEIHKFDDGPLRYLYRCGHPGTHDYCALYSDEIISRAEAERIANEERKLL